MQVVSERWQGQAEGVFQSPHFLAFHEQIWPVLLRQGALEMAWMTVRGEPLAAVYNLVWNNKVYFYQCGRKPDGSVGVCRRSRRAESDGNTSIVRAPMSGVPA